MKPLHGVTVLDISRLLPGGFASLLLSQLGARIIKVEQPGVGDYYRATLAENTFPHFIQQFGNLNQGKESLALDLKSDEGCEIFKKLVKKADVVIESFRPGTLKRLKIDYAVLKKIRPQIILCSITGSGPKDSLAGHDINFMGLAGLLDLIRDPGGEPVIPDFQVVDLVTGYEAVSKISASLFQRTRTKKGCWIDASMLEAGLSLAQAYRDCRGGLLSGGLLRYGVYETADGQWMTLGALEPKFWSRFCEKIGRSEWAVNADSYQSLGEEKREELRQIFGSKTAREWEKIGQEEDVCLFPIRTIEELDFEPRRKIPSLGQHTDKILKSLSYRKDQLRLFRKQGIIE